MDTRQNCSYRSGSDSIHKYIGFAVRKPSHRLLLFWGNRKGSMHDEKKKL